MPRCKEGLAESVPLCVADCVPAGEALRPPLPVPLGVALGQALRVEVLHRLALPPWDAEGVKEGVTVPVALPLAVAGVVTVGVELAVEVSETSGEGVGGGEGVSLADAAGDALPVALTVGAATVAVPLVDCEGLALPSVEGVEVPVAPCVVEALCVLVKVMEVEAVEV